MGSSLVCAGRTDGLSRKPIEKELEIKFIDQTRCVCWGSLVIRRHNYIVCGPNLISRYIRHTREVYKLDRMSSGMNSMFES